MCGPQGNEEEKFRSAIPSWLRWRNYLEWEVPRIGLHSADVSAAIAISRDCFVPERHPFTRHSNYYEIFTGAPAMRPFYGCDPDENSVRVQSKAKP